MGDHEFLRPDDTPADQLLATLERFRPLVGVWRGRGKGRYPTIDPFTWEERLEIGFEAAYPMLSWCQRTWLLPDRSPSHWEDGLLRPVADGVVDYSSVQDSGRAEILRCRPGAASDRFEFDCVALAHDPRLVETRREYIVNGEALSYQVFMATRTTARPEMLLHLEAQLTRE